MDTAGEGEGGVNSREALDIYITICKTDGQWEAMHNIGNSTYGHSVTTWRGGMAGGREAEEGGDVCVIMTGLHYHIAGTNTTLQKILITFKKI